MTVSGFDPAKPHFWEPPDSRSCAICGVDYDEHGEPDLDFGPIYRRDGEVKRYKLVPIEEKRDGH
jgi:hypothetical protein